MNETITVPVGSAGTAIIVIRFVSAVVEFPHEPGVCQIYMQGDHNPWHCTLSLEAVKQLLWPAD